MNRKVRGQGCGLAPAHLLTHSPTHIAWQSYRRCKGPKKQRNTAATHACSKPRFRLLRMAEIHRMACSPHFAEPPGDSVGWTIAPAIKIIPCGARACSVRIYVASGTTVPNCPVTHARPFFFGRLASLRHELGRCLLSRRTSPCLARPGASARTHWRSLQPARADCGSRRFRHIASCRKCSLRHKNFSLDGL